MANTSTLTLVLGNVGGQLGGIDGVINASVSANAGDGAGTVSGTITAIGNAAGMFPGALGAYGGFAVTMSNLAKTGFDGSKLTIGDALTIGAGVAALVGAPLIGFGLTVAGIGWTVYTLSDPSMNLTLPDLFDRAKEWLYPRDPIILDLDGNGLETVGLNTNVYFDHDGDGVLTKTGWANKTDALLVWDRNANGNIDTGAELFGDFTALPNGTLAPNGFAALAALDANSDGILDASDPAFANLKLWRDSSQDGETGAGELISLADAGIVSLNLSNSLKNQTLANGNQLAREGNFTRADGTTAAMGEFRLATDTFHSRFSDAIAVPDELKTLPNMGGSGKVRELQQAAAQSAGLQGLLEQFQTAKTHGEQKALLDQLLIAWADTSGMAKSLNERAGSNFYVEESATSELQRKLHVLEAFNGQYFFNLPGEKSATQGANNGLQIRYGYPVSWRDNDGVWYTGFEPYRPPLVSLRLAPEQRSLLNTAYNNLSDSIFGSLALQTRLKPYLDQIELIIDEGGMRRDVTALNQLLAEKRAADPEAYLGDLLDLDRYAGSFLAGTDWSGLTDLDSFISSLPQTETLKNLLADSNLQFNPHSEYGLVSLSDGRDIVFSGEGNEHIYGHGGDDRLFGRAGDDYIDGGSGDDLLSGGAGNDRLDGSSGADTYVFGSGFGHDTIVDTAVSGVSLDSVRFVGLNPADIAVSADRYENVTFTIITTGETLNVSKIGVWKENNSVGQYIFANGTVWSHEDALRASVVPATAGDDVIHGVSAADRIAGLAGNDLLVGNGGDDVIDGGAGNDVLLGSTSWTFVYENGSYSIARATTGSTSNNGNDTYLFGRGDGQDTLMDGDYTSGNLDTLRFKEGVVLADVSFARSGNDLVIAIRNSGDQITLKRYLESSNGAPLSTYSIERIAFVDGTTLGFAEVQALLLAGTEAAETLIGLDADDLISGQGGDDLLLGGAGQDVLDGGAGNDVLRGGGMQTYNGKTYDGDGAADTYKFGRGDGHDVIKEDSWQLNETDRLVFKAGISLADVRLERLLGSGAQASDDLKITLRDTGETIIVSNHFNESNRYAVEEIIFADGTSLNAAAIQMLTLAGSAESEVLYGFAERSDDISGLGGDDVLYGVSGDDQLSGGAGDDVLVGGTGADSYHFGRGFGRDLVIESASDTLAENLVLLDSTVQAEDLLVRKSGTDLVLQIVGTSDELVLRGAASYSSGSSLAAVRFADGSAWSYATLQSRAIVGTAGDDRLEGFAGQHELIGGGAGNDTLLGGTGADTYLFGRGDGQDVILDRDTDATAIDSLRFGAGVLPTDVNLVRDGRDLIARINDTDDSIAIKGFYQWGEGTWLQRVERMEFVDGAVWQAADIASRADQSSQNQPILGSVAADQLTGNEQGNVLKGLDGNDILEGGAGNDTLEGGLGSDTLRGGAGDDVLYGLSQASLADEDDALLTPTANYYLNEAGNSLIKGLSLTQPGFGEQSLSRSSNESRGPIDITSVFGAQGLNFFGENQTKIYVNENGNITFGAKNRYTQPASAGFSPIIAPFYVDVNIEGGPVAATPGGNSSGSNLVYYDLDAQNGVLTVTWDDVEGEDVMNKYNAFQLQLVNRGEGDFDIIFRYEAVNWASDWSDVAYTGYGSDDWPDPYYFEMPASGNYEALLALDETIGNTGRVGVHVFHFRNGHPVDDNGTVIPKSDSALNYLFGGVGDDTYVVDTAGDVVTEYVEEGTDIIQSSVAMVLPNNVENLLLVGGRSISGTGNELANSLTGNAAGNTLYGREGDDVLDGGAGFDNLYGGQGADTLRAGAQGGLLSGDDGGDTYIYNIGDGAVHIHDSPQVGAAASGELNTLVFGEGIRLEDVSFTKYQGYLWMTFAGKHWLEEYVRLDGYSAQRATQTYSVDIIRFADGREIREFGLPDRSGDDALTLQAGVAAVGGSGSDTYSLALDSAAVGAELVIVETGRAGDENRLELSGAVNIADLQLSFDGTDLLLHTAPRAQVIRFAGFDPRTPGMLAPINEVVLTSSGARITFAQLLERGISLGNSAGSDTLEGTNLADRIVGSEGDDTLSGGLGGDTYIVSAAEGSDTIIDTESGAAPNCLVLPEGTKLNDLRLSYDNQGFLLIDLLNTGNQIRLSGFDPQNPLGAHAVERFRFGSTGDEISYAQLLSRGFDIVGTAQDDSLSGTALSDRIQGGNGNDLLQASQGGDWLAGGNGNDAYVVNLGDGLVTIDDLATDNAGNQLRFGAGIEPTVLRNNLRFVADDQGGYSLLLGYGADGDVLRLNNFNPQDVLGAHAIESFEFADGTTLNYATLVSWIFVVEGDSGSNSLAGTNVNDRLYGYAGDDLLIAGNGDDVLTGGAGDDDLRGGAGRDAYVVNLGDGYDQITDTVSNYRGNVLTFGSGIQQADLNIQVAGADLLIHYSANGDSLRVQDAAASLADAVPVIDTLEFVDGTIIPLREFMQLTPTIASAIQDSIVLEDAGFSVQLPADLFLSPDSGHPLAQVMAPRLSQAPDWLRYDPQTRRLYGTPNNDDLGEFDIVLEGLDAQGAPSRQGFRIAVQNTNDAPMLVTPLIDQRLVANTPFGMTLPSTAFVDVDRGDKLTFVATQENGVTLPSWLSFDAATLRFSGVPDSAAVGSINVKITATDSTGAAVSDLFSVMVEADSTVGVSDQIILGDWYDNILLGGVGDDIAYSNGGSDYINLLGGNNIAYGSFGNDTILAGSGNDTLYGDGGNNLIAAGDGQNRIYADWGDDTITSGSGNDLIEAGGGRNRIEAGAGDDQITTLWGDDWIDAGAGDNLISAGEGYNQIFSGVGHDLIKAFGVNLIQSGAGNDDITLGWGADNIDAGAGDDVIRAGGGGDSVRGGAGDDLILASQWSNDTYIFGRNDGEDIISDDGGTDVLVFEEINADELRFQRVGGDLQINIAGQTDSVTVQGWYSKSFGTIEQIKTSDGTVLLDSQVVVTTVAAKPAFAKTAMDITAIANENIDDSAHTVPPEHSINVNSEAITPFSKPSLPQELASNGDPLSSFLDSFNSDGESAQSALPVMDRSWFEQWSEQQQLSGQAIHSEVNTDVERHWAEVNQALNQLDAERQSAFSWSHPSQGADLTGLAGWMQTGAQGARGSADTVSLSGGTGTQLKGFTGISEGVSKLPW